jgi:hypothetical protein
VEAGKIRHVPSASDLMKQIMPEVVAKVRQRVAACLPQRDLRQLLSGELPANCPPAQQKLLTFCLFDVDQDAAAFGKRAVSFVSAFDLEAAAAYDISSPRSDASDDARQTMGRDGGGSVFTPYEQHHLDADQGP